ncbi:hypothetical protein CRUP_016059, partial [Coryphaenoides rupestris]
ARHMTGRGGDGGRPGGGEGGAEEEEKEKIVAPPLVELRVRKRKMTAHGNKTTIFTLSPLSSGNVSVQSPLSNDTSIVSSTATTAVGAVILSLGFLLGVPGNLFIIWSILARARKQSVTTLLILNLAYADGSLMVLTPFFVVYLVQQTWVFGKALCKILFYLCLANMYASIMLITLMSLHRFAAIVWPNRVRALLGRRAALRTLAGVWVLVLVASVPAILFREQRTLITRGTTRQVYVCILRRIRQTKFQRRVRSEKLILAIVVTFCVFWLPYHLVNMMQVASALCQRDSDLQKKLVRISTRARVVTSSLAFISSCANPVLYVFAGKSYIRRDGLAFMARLFEGTALDSGGTTRKSRQNSRQDERGESKGEAAAAAMAALKGRRDDGDRDDQGGGDNDDDVRRGHPEPGVGTGPPGQPVRGVVGGVARVPQEALRHGACWCSNLAVADALVLLGSPLFLRYLTSGRGWEFGGAACKLVHYLSSVNMYVSIYLIALMSGDRCLAVARPFAAQRLRTHRTLLATLLAKQHKNITINYCTQYHWESVHHEVFQYLLETLMGFAVPFTFIVGCYATVVYRLRSAVFQRRGQSSRLILLIVGAFGLFWMPYHIINVMEVSGLLQGNGAVVRAAREGRPNVTAFAYFSSAINPVLYVFAGSSHIRRAGCGFMGRLFEATNSETRTSTTGSGRTRSSRGGSTTAMGGAVTLAMEDESSPLRMLSLKLGRPFRRESGDNVETTNGGGGSLAKEGRFRSELNTLASLDQSD